MMMQMLAAGGLEILMDEIRKADDGNPLGYFEYEPVKRLIQEQDWLKSAEGKVVKIISIFLEHLPEEYDYRVIFMQRDLEAVVRSQNELIRKLQGETAAGNMDILKRTFQQQVAKTLSWCEHRRNIDLTEVEYQAVLDNPQQEAERISKFLGGVDATSMARAVDPDLQHHI